VVEHRHAPNHNSKELEPWLLKRYHLRESPQKLNRGAPRVSTIDQHPETQLYDLREMAK